LDSCLLLLMLCCGLRIFIRVNLDRKKREFLWPITWNINICWD
jgi:hypothetical protein